MSGVLQGPIVARGTGWELRPGDWRDVFSDLRERDPVDAIICDPPYGKRTHDAELCARADGHSVKGLRPSYQAWTPGDVREFVNEWSPLCRGWFVCLTSHDLIPAFETAHAEVGRYCFAPVPCVMRGMSVRQCGDGPSSWTVYAVVARPRTRLFARWGTLDGAYYGPCSHEAGGGRGKPAWLMQAIVRDYTRVGNLVVDPFAGWGSTLAAAAATGRPVIGSEVDPAAFTEAVRRLRRPTQYDLLTS